MCQLLTDVVGVEVVVPEGAVHSGLLGALVATGAAGGADGAAAAFSARAAARYRPDPEAKSSYDASYRRFRLAYPALKGVFARGE